VLLILLASLSVGAAVALVARALLMNRMRAAQSVGQVGSYGFASGAETEVSRGPLRALVEAMAGGVGSLVASSFGAKREAEIRRELVAAGFYTMPPRRFIGYRVLCTIVFPAVWIWASASAGTSGIIVVFGLVVAFLTGWLAPARVVQARKQKRLAEVDLALPELIDLLVVTVEAGLGFSGSLQIAADRIGGTLGDELRLTLQEQRMGMSTNDSLRNMLDRADSPAMRSFVRSVLQGETLGVSIGQIMRNLAVEMRKRRKALAEEKAQKAPIKILFPLVFLIFPAMFVILLGPAVFSFLDAFSGR
jgi:tight adherence protein C